MSKGLRPHAAAGPLWFGNAVVKWRSGWQVKQVTTATKMRGGEAPQYLQHCSRLGPKKLPKRWRPKSDFCMIWGRI